MTSASPSPDPRIGTVLRGKYRLDRVIGIGGMAVVYKATHRNHAEFAVKMLHPELSIREDIRSRFVREGYTANAVKHPGAVLVVDDDVAEDGAAFLVMELLDGVSCEQLWGSVGRKVSPEVSSAIAIQLLDVLAAAHEKGIIHRDIKPANLFLTRPGVVKVLDFGIAKAREAIAGSHATVTGMTLGTPAFMAPEHARGRSREMDGRTDLWAVGATFFAMTSGQLVHDAETANEFLIAAGTRPARSLASAAPEVPAPIAAVMDRALAFEKSERWSSAGSMRDALQEAHRACFGGDDVEGAVAAAVKASAARSPAGVSISPAAETRTTPAPFGETVPAPREGGAPAAAGRTPLPASSERPGDGKALQTPLAVAGRAATERFSTSGAISRDREGARARALPWPAGVGIAAVLATTLGGAAWMKARHTGGAPLDGGTASASIATARDAIAPLAPAAIDPPAERAAVADAGGLDPSRAPELRGAPELTDVGDRRPHGAPPAVTEVPRHPPVSRHAGAPDAGAPPASCNPPWFLDSAGHKQYKPECI